MHAILFSIDLNVDPSEPQMINGIVLIGCGIVGQGFPEIPPILHDRG